MGMGFPFQNKSTHITYYKAPLFELFEQKLGAFNLVQLVDFDTWSRIVGLMLKSSCIDHVYVKNLEIINNITHLKPCFGDHELVLVQLNIIRPEPKTSIRRDWRHYIVFIRTTILKPCLL